MSPESQRTGGISRVPGSDVSVSLRDSGDALALGDNSIGVVMSLPGPWEVTSASHR